MAVGDVYEVTDVQTLQGQEVQNVYFYRQEGAFVPFADTIAQALADEFVETVIPVMLGIQSADLIHTEVRVRNLFDTTDAGVSVAALPGDNANPVDTLPSFAAMGIGLKTDNSAVRPGAKRLAGLIEAGQADGVLIPSYVTALNTVGAALAAPITGGLIITEDIMFPVVVQRVRTGTPGNYEYRLPETSGELVFGTIIEYLVKTFVTSQISRKFGVGL